MPLRILLCLSHENRKLLGEIIARGADWRQRQRAQTLLYLDDGMSTREVAEIVGIHARTVAITRKYWFRDGFESLVDLSRSGAPRKITGEQLAKLVEAASAEPLTAKELLARHLEDGGAPVHVRTVVDALRASGMVWKRTRHSLKKTK